MKKYFVLISFLISRLVISQTGIGTDSPKAVLDINGDLIIRKTPVVKDSNLKPVFINAEGLVVTKDQLQVNSSIFFAETIREVYPPSADNAKGFNEGREFEIPFLEKDIIINNLNIAINNTSLKIGTDGTYQISTSIGFQIGVSKAANEVYLNVRLEKSTNNGNTWETLIGIRPVFPIYWIQGVGQGITFSIPPTVSLLKKNDLIRIVFNRTKGGASFQGPDITNFGVKDVYSSKAYTISVVKL